MAGGVPEVGAADLDALCHLIHRGVVADQARAVRRQLPCDDAAAGGGKLDHVAADARKGVQQRGAGATLRVVPARQADACGCCACAATWRLWMLCIICEVSLAPQDAADEAASA